MNILISIYNLGNRIAVTTSGNIIISVKVKISSVSITITLKIKMLIFPMKPQEFREMLVKLPFHSGECVQVRELNKCWRMQLKCTLFFRNVGNKWHQSPTYLTYVNYI